MLNNRNHIIAASLLAFMIAGFSRELAAEEYVWARFYGVRPPAGYATDGFGSYYVPKSMATNQLQTDPTRKPADTKQADAKPAKPKPPAKKTAESKPSEPVVESETPKPAPQTKKSFWKRMTFQK